MSYNLFLDDERELAFIGVEDGTNWKIARSFKEAVDIHAEFGVPSFVSFDHDLGDPKDGSGHDYALFLIVVELDGHDKWPADFDFQVHSMNPVGALNIKGLMDSYIKYRQSPDNTLK